MSDYAVVNPVTGQTLATYPTTTDAELETAIASAAAAYRSWREVPVPERAARIRRAAKLHRERRDELAAIIVREMGKPLAAALGEVDFAADITEYYADNAERITGDQPIDILGEGTAVIRRSPLGVLLGIMPWNFPYYQVARFAAPNLAVGNTILLKHAPQCPAAERLADQVDRALAQGATLVAGGTRDGAFYAPTVLTGVTKDMDAYREEFFGPVGVVYRVADEDEAVALANDTSYGLGSYVFTTDQEQAARVADRIDAGMVYVNLVLADSPELPFGGVKRSGTSREMGLLAADEFVNKKLIRVGA
jgi:acyl-CoA reductase-like NAD-dependent aldehyde dehydrogenase